MTQSSVHCYQDANGNELIIEERSPFLQKYTYSNRNPMESKFSTYNILFGLSKLLSGITLILVILLKYAIDANGIENFSRRWLDGVARNVICNWMLKINGLRNWHVNIITIVTACIILRRRYQSKYTYSQIHL